MTSSFIDKRKSGESKTAHTPGPWAVHAMFAYVVPADHVKRPIGAAEDAETDLATYAQEICAIRWPDHRLKEEMLANARLIAAAPDLLAALQWFVDDIDGLHQSPVNVEEAEANARAAIAKAEGRS